jgi:transcription initiation factor TFIIB
MRQTVKFEGKSNVEERAPHGASDFKESLKALSASLNVPEGVKERAISIASEAAAMRSRRPTPGIVLSAAALYVACRESKVPMTFRELAAASGADLRDIGRCYAGLLERMNIARPGLNGGTYVHHLALKPPLSEETYRASEEIIKQSTSAGLDGRNPMTLAAAALYLASCGNGEKVTQSEVADAAGVGEESVRECCKAIRAMRSQKGSAPGKGASLNR